MPGSTSTSKPTSAVEPLRQALRRTNAWHRVCVGSSSSQARLERVRRTFDRRVSPVQRSGGRAAAAGRLPPAAAAAAGPPRRFLRADPRALPGVSSGHPGPGRSRTPSRHPRPRVDHQRSFSDGTPPGRGKRTTLSLTTSPPCGASSSTAGCGPRHPLPDFGGPAAAGVVTPSPDTREASPRRLPSRRPRPPLPVPTPEARLLRKERRAWYMYDWAQSVFNTTVITVFLGPYLTALASG